MSETTTPNNGSSSAGTEGQKQPNARIVGQFIKDLSFENPNISKLLTPPSDKPELKIEVNVNATKVDGDLFESAIEFSAKAQNKDGVLYDLELVYAGLFQLENLPPDAVEPVLLVNSPMLLFPFVRRIVVDITREGGFPPLYLDPIDFGALYMSRKQQDGGKAGPASPAGSASS